MKNLKIVLCVATAISVVAFALSIYYTMFVHDTVSPVISMDKGVIDVSVDDDDDVLLRGITAVDNRSGDLTDQVFVAGTTGLTGYNTAKVTYFVFDEADNLGIASRLVRYTDYASPCFSLTDQLVYAVGEQVSLKGKVFATDSKEGNITNYIRLSIMNLNNKAEGVYHVTLRIMNRMGDTSSVTLPVIIRNDTVESPQIRLNTYLLYINEGDSFDPETYFDALFLNGFSKVSGTYDKLTVTNDVDTSTAGCYEVHYEYTNSSGLRTEAILTVVVQNVEDIS